MAPHLADVHDTPEIELVHPSTEFNAQRRAYSLIVRRYRSALFPFAAGRALLTSRLMLSTGSIETQLRIVGEAKKPVTGALMPET